MDFHWSQMQGNDFTFESIDKGTLRFVQMFPFGVLFAQNWIHLLNLQRIMSMFNISFKEILQRKKNVESWEKINAKFRWIKLHTEVV